MCIRDRSIDRTGYPVVTALPLSDAQLATIRLGKPGTQFTGKPVIALDAIYPQNGAFRICADPLYTARPHLANPYELALTIDIQYRSARKTGRQPAPGARP